MKVFEEKDGKIYINLSTTESSNDWLRAGRLKHSKKKKDREEYAKMDKQEMRDVTED